MIPLNERITYRYRLFGLSRDLMVWLQEKNDSPDRPSRLQIVLWGILLIMTIIISIIKIDTYQLGTHFDDTRYLILARSLLYSDRYGMINYPSDPVPERYPFGYPLLLTPFLVLFPNNFVALTVLSLIAALANITILFFGWRWFCKSKSYWWGLGFISLYALSPMIIDLIRRVMSETVFVAFCLAAILLAERYAAGIRSRWWTTWMSIVLTFVVYTRTIGIVLVGCAFLYLLLVTGRRFWLQIGLILAQMIALIGIIVWVTPIQPRDLLPLEYLKDENARGLVAPFNTGSPSIPQTTPTPTDVSPHLAHDWKKKLIPVWHLFTFGFVQHFGRDIWGIAIPIGGGKREQAFSDYIGFHGLPLFLGYIVSALVLLGVIRLWKRDGKSLFLLFAVAYFGAIFLWYWNDPRLLNPIQIQIYLGFFAGLEGVFVLLNRFTRHKAEIFKSDSILASLMIFFVLVSAYKSATIQDSRLHAGDLSTRTSWLKANSASTDIILTEAPGTDYLYSDRKTVMYPKPTVTSTEGLDRYLHEFNVTYVLIAPEIKWMSSYRPEYSAGSKRVLQLTEGLLAQNRVRLAYSSDEELIKVFQVLP